MGVRDEQPMGLWLVPCPRAFAHTLLASNPVSLSTKKQKGHQGTSLVVSVVKNLSCNAEDPGLIPGLVRSHLQGAAELRASQLLKSRALEPVLSNKEKPAQPSSLCTVRK